MEISWSQEAGLKSDIAGISDVNASCVKLWVLGTIGVFCYSGLFRRVHLEILGKIHISLEKHFTTNILFLSILDVILKFLPHIRE